MSVSKKLSKESIEERKKALKRKEEFLHSVTTLRNEESDSPITDISGIDYD